MYGTSYGVYGTSYWYDDYHYGHCYAPRSYLGINLATHNYHLGINLATVHYQPYRYYYHGNHYSYVSNYGYHHYSLGRSHYRFCRPVYYSYPTYYGSYYDGYNYQTTSTTYIVRDDDAYEEGNEAGYVDGYRDGYYDGAMNETIYGASDRRSTLTRSTRAGKTSLFTTAWSKTADQGSDAYAAGDYDAAVKSLKDASIANPTSATLKIQLGQSAFASQRYELAAFSMRRALELNGSILDETPSPRAEVPEVIIYDQQLEALENEVEKDSRSASLRFLLGTQKYLIGDYAGAALNLEAAATLNENDALARNLYQAAAKRAKD